MPAWFSPFPLEPPLQQRLRHLDWQRWEGDPAGLPADGVALYAPPDQLLANPALDFDQLLAGYQALLALDPAPRLVSVVRLLAERPSTGSLQSEPLAAVITLWALEQMPALLETYLDLELRADLLGDAPDLAYGERLRQQLQPAAVLQDWRSPAALQRQLQVAQDEADLTLVQLQHLQDELEHVVLLSQAQQQLLAEHRHLAAELLDQLALRVSSAAAPPAAA